MLKKIYKNTLNYIKENYKVLLFLVLFIFLFTFELPYYVNATGGTIDTIKRVKVEDSYKVEGSFNMAYVNEIKATIPTYLISLFNDKWDLVKEEDMTYGDMTIDEVMTYGRISMKESNKDAIKIAYEKAGIDVKEYNKKTVMIFRYEEADTDLVVGDVITEIDGEKVKDFESLTNKMKEYKVGDRITLKVTNDDKKYERYANIVEIDGEPKIGILLKETRDIKTKPECELFYTKSESGASGGLMTALTIYNYLVKEDITGGLDIAGTGTIEPDGSVGEISGIKYKLAGVVKEKMDIFIVPAGENYKEALKEKEKHNYDIKIVPVSTFEEALTYLENNVMKKSKWFLFYEFDKLITIRTKKDGYTAEDILKSMFGEDIEYTYLNSESKEKTKVLK